MFQPNYSFIHQDIIYTAGTKNRGIAFHDISTGKLNGSVKIPLGMIVTNFFVHNELIYVSVPEADGGTIMAFDEKGKIKYTFGDPFSHIRPEERFAKNRCQLLPLDERLFVAVGESEPVIRTYTYEGILTSEFDFRQHEIFKRYYEGLELRIRKTGGNTRNMTFILFQDVFVKGRNLYLLMFTYDIDGNISLDNILVMEMAGKSCKPVKIYDLSDSDNKRYYTSIAINNKGILTAFDALSSQFHFFDIKSGE